MAATPPTYTGPTTGLMDCSTYSKVDGAGGTGQVVLNPQNLIDGNRSTLTLFGCGLGLSNTSNISDKYLVGFPIPPSIGDAEILSFRYVFKDLAREDSYVGLALCVLEAKFTDTVYGVRGIGVGMHEQTTTRVANYDDNNEYSNYTVLPTTVDNQGTYGIGSQSDSGIGSARVSGSDVLLFASMSKFAGVTLSCYSGSNYVATAIGKNSISGFGVEILYTPTAPGTSLALTISSFTQIDATTMGIAVANGTECAFDTPSNVASEDTSYALATSPGDVETTTKFLTAIVASAQLTTAKKQRALELRVPVLAFFRGVTPVSDRTTGPDYAVVQELVLMNSSGTVLLQLSTAGNDPYKHLTYGIPVTGNVTTNNRHRNERYRTACLNLRTLTRTQVDDIHTNGCKVGIRWYMYSGSADGSDPTTQGDSEMYVNKMSVSWVYGDLAAASITPATTAFNTQSSSGLVGTTPTQASHIYIRSIQHGKLYKNNGSTEITPGTFITKAEWEAGLKFTPTTGFSGVAKFYAQGATSNATDCVSGPQISGLVFVAGSSGSFKPRGGLLS